LIGWHRRCTPVSSGGVVDTAAEGQNSAREMLEQVVPRAKQLIGLTYKMFLGSCYDYRYKVVVLLGGCEDLQGRTTRMSRGRPRAS